MNNISFPVSKERGNFLDALKESPTSAIVVVISFFGMWTVLGKQSLIV